MTVSLQKIKKHWRRVYMVVILAVFCLAPYTPPVNALDGCQKEVFHNGIRWFNCYDGADTGCTTTIRATTAEKIPSGYIAPKALIDAAGKHSKVYQQVSQETGVPAMLFAVLHYRENTFGLDWPGNGQGIYQFYPETHHPKSGTATPEQFLEQTRQVFTKKLKGKMQTAADAMKKDGVETPKFDVDDPASVTAALNDADFLKAVMFAYNGWAGVYANQAENLGYNKKPWEGSPYVMNLWDAPRNGSKASNPKKWGQIKIDNGPIEYPANDAVGAFTLYVALGGSASGNTACDGNTGGGLQSVVAIAEKEYEEHKGFTEPGGCNCGGPVPKYTNGKTGPNAPWCAWFVSWVFKEAGLPFGQPNWEIPAVVDIQAWFRNHPNKAEYFDAGEKLPQPGDVAFYIGKQTPDRDSGEHVNIVISVDAEAKTMVTIGGNESNGVRKTVRKIQFGADNLVGFGRRTQ